MWCVLRLSLQLPMMWVRVCRDWVAPGSITFQTAMDKKTRLDNGWVTRQKAVGQHSPWGKGQTGYWK